MSNLLIILGFPLFGFIFNGLVGKYLPKSVVGSIASLMVAIPFFVAFGMIGDLSNDAQYSVNWKAYTFLTLDNIPLSVSFTIDRLSVWMTLIITGVGALIHLYSTGYMKNDEGFYKFFSYLNFFIFNMLLLVLGSNFLMMFFGWEGVGLCSYLLIGFWYKNVEFGKAARKAFVMNRIGDLGLLLGLYLIFSKFHTLEYSEFSNQIAAGNHSDNLLNAISILLFIGAMGKSAQIPLYTWLPDAMAGPTPVSALIHAATMVTAGIYLIIRNQILFALSPFATEFILWIGLATAMLAALIGLKQTDIKKVLAYSTVSQLGFMFVALGVGAYSTALFHLTTHAFFKALLFLGAGSVIHGMHHEQDMRFMGGLKKKMPLTYWTFLAGTLAISGFPFFSGFFSKDEILAATYSHGLIPYILLLLSALLTGIYMFRMFFVTFHGTYRNEKWDYSKVHESPLVMTIPLMILAVFSVFGGLINLPKYITESGSLVEWLKPMLPIMEHHEIGHSEEIILLGLAVLVFLTALIYTRIVFLKRNRVPTDSETGFFSVMRDKFYVDEAYNLVIVRPLEILGDLLHLIGEGIFLKIFSFGIYPLLQVVSRLNKRIQNGNIEFYLLYMIIAVIVLLGVNLIFF